MGPGIPVRKASLDLLPLCERIVDEIRAFHPSTDIQFAKNASAGGDFDGARMEQVFSNLISNAVKHGDNKYPIEVELGVSGDTVVFSVHNSGEPIPEDVLPFIFNPMGRFSKHSVIDHGPSEGLGLGLFIASEIVTSHGGIIEVISTQGHGTTFVVRLPQYHLDS